MIGFESAIMAGPWAPSSSKCRFRKAFNACFIASFATSSFDLHSKSTATVKSQLYRSSPRSLTPLFGCRENAEERNSNKKKTLRNEIINIFHSTRIKAFIILITNQLWHQEPKLFMQFSQEPNGKYSEKGIINNRITHILIEFDGLWAIEAEIRVCEKIEAIGFLSFREGLLGLSADCGDWHVRVDLEYE